MNEIKISVEDKNLETVLLLLTNLKEGLVNNISTNGRQTTSRPTQYQPKAGRIIKEEESGTNDSSGKYANANAYKQRLNNRK